jgi:magnesium chelatase family protein
LTVVSKASAVSTVLSRAPLGLSAPLVRVEVHLAGGLPTFVVVGLPETVVRESRERVRSALVTAGFDFPMMRITVNLSPADLPKAGGRFDLPIALGILAAHGQLPARSLRRREFYGELSLAGDLRETPMLLPALLAGSRAGRELFLQAANGLEASLIAGAQLRLATHLREICEALRGRPNLSGPPPAPSAAEPPPPDLADIRGQFAAKRALEIAASGEHGLLLVGPPGAGKTLLAQRLPGLLPPLEAAEALEVASVESAAGRRPGAGRRRPFRHPQHTASVASLIGGSHLRPGELSLAHRGVLFLDELPEFARDALEALREPLESGVVILARARSTCEFPACFQLVAAMNPCACGYHGDPQGRCHCTAGQVARYRGRVSGPLLDRIDIHVELAGVGADDLVSDAPSIIEGSAAVAARVAAARRLQLERQGKLNARLSAAETARICRLDRRSRALLGAAISRLGLSARAYSRVLKLARTCADLAAVAQIESVHVAEAIQLRALDRPIG